MTDAQIGLVLEYRKKYYKETLKYAIHIGLLVLFFLLFSMSMKGIKLTEPFSIFVLIFYPLTLFLGSYFAMREGWKQELKIKYPEFSNYKLDFELTRY